MLELELYKLRIELDIMHEIMSNIINTQQQAAESRNMDSGKWYPRKNPTPNS